MQSNVTGPGFPIAVQRALSAEPSPIGYPNTYPRAYKEARPPSSRLRRAEQRLSREGVPHAGRDEDRFARADRSTFAIELMLRLPSSAPRPSAA